MNFSKDVVGLIITFDAGYCTKLCMMSLFILFSLVISRVWEIARPSAVKIEQELGILKKR